MQTKKARIMDVLNLDHILLNSCYNPHYEEDFDWSKWDGKSKPEWRKYTIDTHCLQYNIIAKLNADGKTYTIRSYTVEDI